MERVEATKLPCFVLFALHTPVSCLHQASKLDFGPGRGEQYFFFWAWLRLEACSVPAMASKGGAEAAGAAAAAELEQRKWRRAEENHGLLHAIFILFNQFFADQAALRAGDGRISGIGEMPGRSGFWVAYSRILALPPAAWDPFRQATKLFILCVSRYFRPVPIKNVRASGGVAHTQPCFFAGEICRLLS